MIIVSKVITIGETLIDFLPTETGVSLKDVSGFTKMPGGAPANVAVCVKRLGAESQIITKIGLDAFGDYLLDLLSSTGIDCPSVFRTNAANTALAFVSLQENGQREFSFYRNPSADMLLTDTEIDESWFSKGDILHFCSVDLLDAPVKGAHDEAIRLAKENGLLISFDPNVRLPLWNDKEKCRETINDYIPKADILKVSDDELCFITGIDDEKQAIQSLLSKVTLLIYTKGDRGAELFTKDMHVCHRGFEVKAIDTTGAGDSFIGAVLYNLLSVSSVANLTSNELLKIAAFANATASLVVTQKGAINAMPTMEEVQRFLDKQDEVV